MDSNRPSGQSGSGGLASGQWSRSSEPLDYPDPAYASQAYEYPTLSETATPYPPPTAPNVTPGDSQQTRSYGVTHDDPEPPRRSTTFWLWVVGIGALVVIIALVIALIALIQREDEQPPIVYQTPSTSTQPTGPPMPQMPSIPRVPSFTLPPLPVNPPTAGSQAATETVAYEVTGTGNAFNITYYDSTGSLQTEFNVALPWRKEIKVSVAQVENTMVIGSDLSHDLKCTLTVNGTPKSSNSGKMALCNGVA